MPKRPGQTMIQRVLVILAIAALPAEAGLAVAPAAATDVRGLDLIFLVDVSRSMRTKDINNNVDKADGSDPKRLRWDAVKLALDLLTDEDRVLVLPFNEESPAVVDWNWKKLRVPGDLPDGLEWLAQANTRQALTDRVASFIQDDDKTPNTDTGSTGIMHALDVAAQRAGRVWAGRQMAVVLLTDGEDRTKVKVGPNELSLIDAKQLLEERNLARELNYYSGSAAQRVPVYVIGLGPEAKRDLLVRIAKVTGGSFWRAQTNRDLIGIFRRLVWDLKGVWVSKDTGSRLVASRPMHGIVDLGLLCSEETSHTLADGSADPRIDDAPSTQPKETWEGVPEGVSMPKRGAPRIGKDQRGYAYYYYGRDALVYDKATKTRRAPVDLELHVDWGGEDPRRTLYLSKRTTEPLFAVVEPAEHERLYRNRALKVRVRMRESAIFRPADFALQASLLPSDAEQSLEDSAPLATCQLKPKAGGDFTGELSLSDLTPTADAFDFYTLAIAVEGTDQRRHSLSGYHLELPRRTVAVDNTLLLEPVAPIALTRAQPTAAIQLRTQFAVQGRQKLQLRFRPPRDRGAALPAAAFLLRSGGTDFSEGSAEVNLLDGRCEVSFGLQPERVPPGGIAYQDGALEVSGGPGVKLRPLSIPIGIRVDIVSARWSSPECTVKAGAHAAKSLPLRIVLDPPDQSTLGIKGPRVSLKADGSPQADGLFSADELWVQPDGAPDLVGKRSQAIELLSLAAPVVVYFEPKAGHKPGRQSYRLTAAAEGMNEVQANVRLLLSPPELEVVSKPAALAAQPGDTITANFSLRLHGRPKEEQEVYLTAAAGKLLFRPDMDGAPQSGPAALDAMFPDAEHRLLLRSAADDANQPPAELNLQISVPTEMRCGVYQTDFSVTGSDIEELPLTIKLTVDELRFAVAGEGHQADTAALQAGQWVQFFERSMTQTVVVTSALGRPLTADDLDVSVPGPFADERGDLQSLPKAIKQPLPGPAGVRVLLTFPKVGNADPCQTYSVKAFFEAPKANLGRRELPIRVWFIEPEELIQSVPLVRD